MTHISISPLCKHTYAVGLSTDRDACLVYKDLTRLTLHAVGGLKLRKGDEINNILLPRNDVAIF